MCHEGGREVPAACPSGEIWDISRGVQHLGILGESAGKPQPQNPGYRAASHLLMRGSQKLMAPDSVDQGVVHGLRSLVGVCVWCRGVLEEGHDAAPLCLPRTQL